MTTITRDALIDLVDSYDAARINAASERSDAADEALDHLHADLGRVLATGTPASEEYAERVGIDYICALDDGTIAAWGADVSLGYSLTGRKLVFISPADQIA